MLGKQVERRAIAEEIGFVVEQSLDHLVRERRLLAHHEDGDELVERCDPALAKQAPQAQSRCASAGSSSAVGRSAPRAAPPGCDWNCRLPAWSPPACATRSAAPICPAASPRMRGRLRGSRGACPTPRSWLRPGRALRRRRRRRAPPLPRRRGPFRSGRRRAPGFRKARPATPASDRPRACTRLTTAPGPGARRASLPSAVDRQVRVARGDEDPVGNAAPCRPRQPPPRDWPQRRAGARTRS